jgi:hypothetical protein
MTATAERVRGWGLLRRILPNASRPATPGPAPEHTPAGATVGTSSHLYTSDAYVYDGAGQTTTALGHAAAPETAEVGERTGIIVRFDADPAEQDDTIPALTDGAELLPAAIFNTLAAAGLPVWHGEPTDVDRSGALCVWNVRGAA